MKTTLLLSALWLSIASFFAPVTQTVLTGKVTGNDGEVLIGANIKLLQLRTLIKGQWPM